MDDSDICFGSPRMRRCAFLPRVGARRRTRPSRGSSSFPRGWQHSLSLSLDSSSSSSYCLSSSSSSPARAPNTPARTHRASPVGTAQNTLNLFAKAGTIWAELGPNSGQASCAACLPTSANTSTNFDTNSGGFGQIGPNLVRLRPLFGRFRPPLGVFSLGPRPTKFWRRWSSVGRILVEFWRFLPKLVRLRVGRV